MRKYLPVACLAVMTAIAGFLAWPTVPVRNEPEPADSGPALVTEEPVQPDDGAVTTPPLPAPPSTTPLTAASGLVHDPREGGAAYLNARDDAQTLLNRGFYDGRVVVRSRVVQVDQGYAARFFADVWRGSDTLSEVFDITLFPDTPCTLSHVASRTTWPRTRAVKSERAGFDIEEIGGEVASLKSHCGSTSELTSAQVRIDTAEGVVFIELVNERAVQQLLALNTDGFMVAIEFDPKSIPRDEQRDVVVQKSSCISIDRYHPTLENSSRRSRSSSSRC